MKRIFYGVKINLNLNRRSKVYLKSHIKLRLSKVSLPRIKKLFHYIYLRIYSRSLKYKKLNNQECLQREPKNKVYLDHHQQLIKKLQL